VSAMRRIDSWEIPILEVSALAARHGSPGGAVELLAVGDARWAVAGMTMKLDGAVTKVTNEVGAAVATGGLPTVASSEFEGVASDGAGRVFVLQEGPSRVLVFDPTMAVLEHAITLKVEADHPDIGAAWTQRPNARGEGVLLLKSGHLLLAKQRDPVRVIEFGPVGDAPLGYAPGSAPAEGEPFVVAGGETSELEVLATWRLESSGPIESINDLAVGGDGRLHFVSSRSRCIGWLEGDLLPGEDMVGASAAPLPAELFADDEDKAEGLVFIEGFGWLVALDLQRAAPNLHQLALGSATSVDATLAVDPASPC